MENLSRRKPWCLSVIYGESALWAGFVAAADTLFFGLKATASAFGKRSTKETGRMTDYCPLISGTEVDRSRTNVWDAVTPAHPANDIGDYPPPNTIMRHIRDYGENHDLL